MHTNMKSLMQLTRSSLVFAFSVMKMAHIIWINIA